MHHDPTNPSHPYVACLLGLLVGLGPSGGVASAQADLSGLEPFFAIAGEYAAGREPTEEAWRTLFETPGYRTLQQREGADRYLARLLPLALSPMTPAEREAALMARGELRPFVQHLRSAYERREELRAFRRELESGLPVDRALEEAAEWLPEKPDHLRRPDVSFVIYQPDARGYDRVVIDLLLAFELPSLSAGLLAHETHHVLRARIGGERRWTDLPESDLLVALDNLQAEGIADQIDRRSMLQRQEWGEGSSAKAFQALIGRFREELSRVQERLVEVDRILTAYAADRDSAAELGRTLRETLVMGGHPVGFHMANVIVEHLGRERLVRHVADPFDFVRAYQRAAAVDPERHHVLSDRALAGLARLEDASVANE